MSASADSPRSGDRVSPASSVSLQSCNRLCLASSARPNIAGMEGKFLSVHLCHFEHLVNKVSKSCINLMASKNGPIARIEVSSEDILKNC